jgi:hypothetical protein
LDEATVHKHKEKEGSEWNLRPTALTNGISLGGLSIGTGIRR